jgi:hypothetical protein
MPRLNMPRPLTRGQMYEAARQTVQIRPPRDLPDASTIKLMAVTDDHDPVVLVWTGVSAPNPCLSPMDRFIPDYVVCPWCKTNLIGTRHGPRCDRPSYLYSHAECGQPDYDDQ